MVSKDDVLIAISTSGKSKNILKTIEMAIKREVKTIFLTGSNPINFNHESLNIVSIPSPSVARIQELHALISHIICEIIEKELGFD